MTFEFKEATTQSTPVTLSLNGKSGTGKTYSALLLARGLVGPDGKIFLIDTEGGRARVYADDPDIGGFIHCDFGPPYSSVRYHEAIKQAVEAGADAIIIDSASHEWEGTGGVLDYAEQIGAEFYKRKGKDAGISKWNKPKMEHNRMVRYAVGCPAHVIFCVRMKQTIDIKTKDVMHSPVIEGQFLYEMMVSFDLDQNHNANIIKLPKPYHGIIPNNAPITVEVGKLLAGKSSEGDSSEYEHQLTLCASAAGFGTEALKNHWGSLANEMKNKLKQKMDDEFKPTAARADAMNFDDDDEQTETD